MKKNIKTFCLFSLTVLFIVSSVSAEGIWKNYTKVTDINDIAVEGDYIWCATDGGVVRWNKQDGTYIKYTNKDGLVSNNVYSIAIDIENVKWFGTYDGVSSFDGTTWTNYITEDGLASNWVESIAVDADNVKWFGTREGGVSHFDGTAWITYTEEDGLVDNYVLSIAVDADNVKWFGTRDGVSSFDDRTISVEEIREVPDVMDILINYPNPFNPLTTITYSIGKPGHVTIEVYNILGQKVETLFEGHREAGKYSVRWDASGLANGIYIAALKAGGITRTEKMMLMK